MENTSRAQRELEEDFVRQLRALAARGIRIVPNPTAKSQHTALADLALTTGVELIGEQRRGSHDYRPPVAMQHVTSTRYEDHSTCPGHCAAVVVTDARDGAADTEARVEVIWCCDTPEVHSATATPLEIAVTQFARSCLHNPDSSTWASFTCGEIDALAAVLRGGGHEDAAAHVIEVHAHGDDEGDDHYINTAPAELVRELQDLVAGKAATRDAHGRTHWWVLAEHSGTGERSIHPVTILDGYSIIEDAPKIITTVRPALVALVAIPQNDQTKVRIF